MQLIWATMRNHSTSLYQKFGLIIHREWVLPLRVGVTLVFLAVRVGLRSQLSHI